jgi:hypothetical protein
MDRVGNEPGMGQNWDKVKWAKDRIGTDTWWEKDKNQMEAKRTNMGWVWNRNETDAKEAHEGHGADTGQTWDGHRTDI